MPCFSHFQTPTPSDPLILARRHSAVRVFGKDVPRHRLEGEALDPQGHSPAARNFALVPRRDTPRPALGLCRASVIGGLRTAEPRIELDHALYQVVFDGRQRPLQFSEDCGGFDFLRT